MNPPNTLAFPDGPKSELDAALANLISSAQRVAETQGRLRVLLRANTAVVEQIDLPAVLKTIVEAAVGLVGARYGALGVMSEDGGLEEFIQVGMTDEMVAQIGRLPEGHGLLGAVLDDAGPIRMHRLQDDPRSVGFPEGHPDMHVFLGVPIRVRGQMFGSLYFAEKDTGDFTVEDEELLTALASTAGIAIDNARRIDETLRRQRWSAVSAEIVTALVAEDAEAPLQLLAERAATLADADLVCIVLPVGAESLVIDTARGDLAEGLEGLVVPARGSVLAETFRSGESLLRSRVADLTDLTGRREPFVLGPTMIIPLLGGETVLGVLTVSRVLGGRRFTAPDVEMVTDFARHATLAIDVARVRLDRHRLELLEDRSRIARDLHDHVIQRLFAAGLDLQSAARVVIDDTSKALIDRQIDTLDTAIAEIRTAIFALGPTRVGESPSVRHRIIDLLAELSGLFPETPRLTFTGPVDLMVADDLGHDLLAVVREGLTNVARHADATHVSVRIAIADDTLNTEITDDGVGIRPSNRSSGLANLTARAERWQGALSVLPGDTGGTVLVWTAALAPAETGTLQ